ncbi:glycosyltransferase family 2 protein [Frigoribacterium sp. ME-P-080]|uniref:glycosyltransferase family 2 protein n=1 Tax=Frigoribacterium sp. ME-P-080 TaxID=3040289 RepID=UPI00255079C4|nr:glycosyltransferase family 2 protein [Frigoribacterium sp. ME-P-080]
MPNPNSSSSEVPTTLVVVVNWNNADLTSRCVAALDREATAPEGADFEVLVVDNGSDDDSVDRLRDGTTGDRLLALTRNGGFAAGVNAAIRHHPADRYVLVNNDAVPAPGFVRALVAHVDAAPTAVAAVTARLELEGRFVQVPTTAGRPDDFVAANGSRWRRDDHGRTLVNSTGGVVDRSGNGLDRDWLVPREAVTGGRDVFGFSGGGVLLRASALEDVGLFDESLFMYYEDTELSWRLAERGHVVHHEPAAVLVHRHSASSGTTSWTFVFHNARNRIKVAVWHASVATVVRAVLRTVVRVLTTTARRSPDAPAVRAALLASLTGLPADLRHRRELARRATYRRRDIDLTTGLRRPGGPSR